MIQDNKKIPKKIKDSLIQNPHWITNDLDLLNQISINAKNIAYEEFNTEILFEKLKHLIFD